MRLSAYLKIGVALVLTALIGILCVPIGMRQAMRPYMYVSLDAVPRTTLAIVLGASVVSKKPSPILAKRADIAISLYQKGRVSKILVTGDSRVDTYDEVTPVRQYLLDAGIPEHDIMLDHAGVDTYSSMYRTAHVFGAESATIVTQDFHLPRALYIARHLGMNAYGVIADGQGSFLGNYMREIFASSKALWDLWAARLPARVGVEDEPMP